jgi:WD40 repeat protein/serine/threonine protein kinase
VAVRPAADQIESILASAVDIESAAERRLFVEQACAGDAELRRRVEEMVENHFRAGSFLERPAVGPAETASLDSPAAGAPPRREPPEAPGDVVGPYKLLTVLGEGGMGTVYVARQTEPVKRLVALKVIKAGMDTRQVLARFEAERQALALMDHPNIAKVFDAGTTDRGLPYIVMELVQGVPITRYCDEHRLNPRGRLVLFVQVCGAVQHAHQKGIIHRDLKPSNVLVAPYDSQPVVKVIDFGVAKAAGQPLTDRTLVTGFGAVIGTPEYMSPEQAELNNADIDTRSDVYSLGVLLYELLTGTTPLTAKRVKDTGLLGVLRLVREEEVPTLSHRLRTTEELASIASNRGTEPAKLTKLVRGELDWIVTKTLEKDRARRYQTANDLAADVQRYLNDEPVLACPPSAWYRFGKFTRRNRREVLAAGAAAVAAVAGVAGLAVSRALIARALRSETRAKEDLRVEVYFQRITVAHRELSIDNLAAALRALEDCPQDLRGWEWHYLKRLFKFEPQVLRDSTEVYGVAFSPDGERIASAGKDGKVKIWDCRTRRVVDAFPAHAGTACSVAFHPDGRHVASAGADRLVKVWDLAATHQPRFQGPCDALRKFGAAYTVAFRPPDGRHLAAGCDQMVRVWDWGKNRPQDPAHTFSGAEYHSIPVAFSTDGRQLATCGNWEQGLSLWDAETGRRLGNLLAHRHPTTALAFSPDGGRLASASLGRSVSLWDTTTHELRHTLPHDGNVLGVAFSPDGQRLVSVGEDKSVHIWDAATGREVLGLPGHGEMCGCVAFAPDGHRLVSSSHDGTIRVWDATPLRVDKGEETLTFPQHDEVRSVAVSPDGRWVASAGNGTLVRVWDPATGGEVFDFPGHSAPVFSVAWDPDGRRIATAGSAGGQNTVKVWDGRTGRDAFPPIPVGPGTSAGPYQVVAFSPDRRYLLTGQLEGAVQLWDATTGQPVRTLVTHEREVRAIVFSPRGGRLATASGDGKVMLWDATRLDVKQEPRLPPLPARVPGPSVNVAFSPDGQRLATGGEGNTVRIWDVQTGREVCSPFRGHSKEVYAVAFSPTDERPWIASGGEDGKVKIWDSRSGELVRTLRGHTGIVSSLAFSPDGNRLYSGSRDKTVKVWDLSTLGAEPNRE